MADLGTLTGAEAASNGAADLFSIDADAHLQKLAACMFPTPAQLPVELVRSALKRNASSVALDIRPSQLVIEDDGTRITTNQWQELACALDGRRSPAAREKAISALQADAHPGIGLLAVLVPNAKTIRIESSGMDGRSSMHVTAGIVRLEEAGPGTRGTRIAIRRNGGPVAAEIRLLRELCAAVPGTITINKRRISRQPVLRRTLVQQAVDIGPGQGAALVAIPAVGDICRIWLLDQQIPWQLFTSASCHGLVFDAALESGSPATGREFSLLAAAAGQLYQWLADHYAAFPPRYQERIEELIFKKVTVAGDLRLLSAFAPFRLWRSQQRLNVEEVRRKAEKGTLYALPLAGDHGRALGSHQEALLLTPRQRDFLINHSGLVLVTPSAASDKSGVWAQRTAALRDLISLLAARLPRRRCRALAAGKLDPGEMRLCRELELFARDLPHRPPHLSLAVAMVAGRGLAPASWRQGPQGGMLFLHRRHPLVRAAVQSVARDRSNVELAFMALTPEYSLTADRH